MRLARTAAVLLTLALLVPAAGCWWLSGPWTGPDAVRDRFETVELGDARSEVEDEFGEPSEIIYPAEPGAVMPEGNQEAWLLYKYDYPTDPLLLTFKISEDGAVSEKHLDDTESVALKRGAPEGRGDDDVERYPGAPQQRFQELIRERTRGGGY